ncbi:MAG: hypothetical protein KAJ62_00900 [Desulfobacteraceae bacterium]|nr:hypothetical protein [Desulfobacteraceae bacterium]
MKNSQKKIKTLLTIAIAGFLLSGCASSFIKGGAMVPRGYEIQKIVVSYRAVGIVPERTDYLLIETDNGEAMFEKSEDGSGVLFLTRWSDDKGDHFAGWVATSHGYEFVIPKDRTKEGQKYFYMKGTFLVKDIDGLRRPVPNNPDTEPVARLIPK